MLIPLFAAAALLAQASAPDVQSVPAATQSRVPFLVSIPPIPSFGVDSLRLAPSRSLMPLATALMLDGRAGEMQDEEDLIAAINSERVSRSLEPLVLDPLLSEAARAHSCEMCALNYFAHQSPTLGERTPVDRYLDALHTFGERRPSSALVGENIFYASVTNAQYNAEYAHQRLMASPSHRKNILEPRFTKVGVGLYRDSQGRFWVTEMFLGDS